MENAATPLPSVEDFTALTGHYFGAYRAWAEPLLYRWAGIEDIYSGSRGGGINSRMPSSPDSR